MRKVIIFRFNVTRAVCLLTDQIIGGDNDATDKQERARDSVVTPKDHVVDNGFIDEITNFHEARNSGHHAEEGHFKRWKLIVSWRMTLVS
jgi:hypothetical protein